MIEISLFGKVLNGNFASTGNNKLLYDKNRAYTGRENSGR